MKKYIVNLTTEEQKYLHDLRRKGKVAAYKIRHANILLNVDVNGAKARDKDAAKAFGCTVNTVENIRKRFVEEGLESALERKKREVPAIAKKLDGNAEARLIAISCSKAPEGRERWTMELLAQELVALKIVDSISQETVRTTLKKTN